MIILQQLISESQMAAVAAHKIAHAYDRHNPTDAQSVAEAEVEARILVLKWGFPNVGPFSNETYRPRP